MIFKKTSIWAEFKTPVRWWCSKEVSFQPPKLGDIIDNWWLVDDSCGIVQTNILENITIHDGNPINQPYKSRNDRGLLKILPTFSPLKTPHRLLFIVVGGSSHHSKLVKNLGCQSSYPWRIHGAGIYNMTGVYWWDPCHHIYSSTMDPMGYSWAYELGTYDHQDFSPVTGVIFQVKGCTRTVHPDVMLVCWFLPMKTSINYMLYHLYLWTIELSHFFSAAERNNQRRTGAPIPQFLGMLIPIGKPATRWCPRLR